MLPRISLFNMYVSRAAGNAGHVSEVCTLPTGHVCMTQGMHTAPPGGEPTATRASDAPLPRPQVLASCGVTSSAARDHRAACLGHPALVLLLRFASKHRLTAVPALPAYSSTLI